MSLFVGRAPVSLPGGPVYTPPDVGGDSGSAPPVSVAYGGIGSGLQAAIDALPDGGVLGLAASTTYDIGSGMLNITGRHGIAIVGGSGTVIHQTSRETDEIIQVNGASSNIGLFNFGITGSNPSPGVWNLTYEHNHAIALRGIYNFEASGIDVLNVGGDGIYVAGLSSTDLWSKNVRFHHGSISGTGRMGVAVTDGGRDVVVDFNTFDHIAYYGLDIEPNGLTIEGIAAGGINVRLSDNAFGVQPFGTDTGGQPVGYIMAITGSSGGGPGVNVQVLRNTLAHGAMRVGVFDNGGARQDIVVSNNTAVDTFTAGAVDECILFDGVSGGAIQNNVQPCTVDGDFYDISGSSAITISGNTV